MLPRSQLNTHFGLEPVLKVQILLVVDAQRYSVTKWNHASSAFVSTLMVERLLRYQDYYTASKDYSPQLVTVNFCISKVCIENGLDRYKQYSKTVTPFRGKVAVGPNIDRTLLPEVEGMEWIYVDYKTVPI